MVRLIIPTFNPDKRFYILLKKLNKQTVKDIEIVIIDSGSSNLDLKEIQKYNNISVFFIENSKFNHGGTRNKAAQNARSEYLIFMTQDAVPKDKYVIEELLAPFSDLDVAVVYGRQIANRDSTVIERFTREFNYPKKSSIKTKGDIERLGIKTFFSTNVCAAYRSAYFFKYGCFPQSTICNEDMQIAFKFILGGKKIVYNANAKVLHSHNYSYVQDFKRNFDIGVSLKDNNEILNYANSEKEGILFVLKAIKYLLKIKKPYLFFDLTFRCTVKLLGYRIGINYKKIPNKIIKYLSLNKSYWNKYLDS